MSDVSQGQGWWIASDGKWYPPELHPSVRAQPEAAVAPGAATTVTVEAAPAAAVSSGAPAAAVAQRGPQFPDLFERARHANAVADTVNVRHDGGAGLDDFYAPTGAATATRRGRRRHH